MGQRLPQSETVVRDCGIDNKDGHLLVAVMMVMVMIRADQGETSSSGLVMMIVVVVVLMLTSHCLHRQLVHSLQILTY